MGRFVRNNFPVTTLTNDTEKEQVNVTGPLCTPLDLIGQNINIDKHIKKGDFIIIEKSGAYGLTYSPFGFLSHEIPMELMIDENENVSILRDRMDIDTFIEKQSVISFD